MLNIELVQVLVLGLLAAIPGIPSGIAGFVSNLMAQLPTLAASGIDLKDFIETQLATVRAMIAEGRDPTADEWTALNGAIGGLLVSLSQNAERE